MLILGTIKFGSGFLGCWVVTCVIDIFDHDHDHDHEIFQIEITITITITITNVTLDLEAQK